MGCLQAVAHRKPQPIRAHHEQPNPSWGFSQVRCTAADDGPWVNWLWAWENPRPEAAIVGLRGEPVAGVVIVSALSAGDVSSHPLRWQPRRKALLTLPEGEALQPELDEHGLLAQLELDMGQVISATLQPLYPAEGWEASGNNQLPERDGRRVLVEYTAHPDACFHLAGGRTISVAEVEAGQAGEVVQPVAPATPRVTLRVVERGSGRPVAVKLHVHGQASEYLAPVDRHRIPNPLRYST